MHIELRDTPFDPYAELAVFQTQQGVLAGQVGAASIFIGIMRDWNAGDAVRSLWLEHYPGMTERELTRIVAAAMQRWTLRQALVIHRIGTIQPDDAIVLIATWSAHRAAALTATRHIIEELKHNAPFWKKETLGQGARWVEHNTPG